MKSAVAEVETHHGPFATSGRRAATAGRLGTWCALLATMRFAARAAAAPDAIGAAYPLPLLAVRGPRRFELIQALRRHPHARSVYPFGQELHYTDDRQGADPARIASDVAAYLASEGFADARVEPAEAGIEDSFMALMGAPESVAA